MPATPRPHTAARPPGLRDVFSLSRIHIVMIAAFGSLVFGYLLTGGFHPGLALLVALDWFLVNLVNRVVDQTEDRVNAIASTELAARHRRFIYGLSAGLLAASFALHLFWAPWLVLARGGYHLLGLLYNFRLIPTPGGARRLKEMFGFKNTASMLGFLLTLFAYPLLAYGLAPQVSWLYVWLLIAYFAPFELCFEAIYDLRDVPGDRAAGVRSYPVVMGVTWTSRMIQLFTVFSVHAVLLGLALGLFGLKEAILGIGPLLQLGLFLRGLARGFRPSDCIRITWTFALMLVGYVLWVWLGMPVDLGYTLSLPDIVVLGLLVIGLLCFVWYGRLYGSGRWWALSALVVLSSWLAEHSAIEFYAFYHYAPDWRFFAGHVPLAVILIWPMVILTSHIVARRLGFTGVSAVLAGSLMVIVEAALIEVVCVEADLWFWEGRGLFGVPLIGMIGWGCFAVGALAVVEWARGRWLLLMPLVGFVSTHLLLQVLWRAGFDRISELPLPDAAAVGAFGLLSLGATLLAWRVRQRVGLSLVEIFPRLLAAELMYFILFISQPATAVVGFAILFIPPYVVLNVYDWTMPGSRPPTDLRPA